MSDAIYNALLGDLDIHHAGQLTDEIFARIAAEGFVVVHVSAVIQQDGKVTVTRKLLESVLEDAETWVNAEYVINDEIYPADRPRYIRDMADILTLRAEIGETSDNSTQPADPADNSER